MFLICALRNIYTWHLFVCLLHKCKHIDLLLSRCPVFVCLCLLAFPFCPKCPQIFAVTAAWKQSVVGEITCTACFCFISRYASYSQILSSYLDLVQIFSKYFILFLFKCTGSCEKDYLFKVLCQFKSYIKMK